MPNAGSHARFSTNWYSALAGSKRHQSSSVAANVTSDTPSATWRTRPSRSGRSPRPPASMTSDRAEKRQKNYD